VFVREGEAGDRFYLVASGKARVSVNGHEVARLDEGDFFGEIALLRNVPRTATVAALTELELYALERDDFLSAVAANPESAVAAEGLVRTRLAGAG
jgi:CRP-like cAMP-binding protein